MQKDFKVIKTKIVNAVEETLIVTKQLGAEELQWLRDNVIDRFDCVEVDLETGEINMAVSFINCNVKEDLDNEEE